MNFNDYVNYENRILEVFDECRKIEFPYFDDINLSQIKTSFNRLKNKDINTFSYNKRQSLEVIKKYHPSLYKANRKGYKSPYEAWNDDELLWKCIENRLIYHGWSLNYKNILAGFTAAKIAPRVSLFNPFLAKYIVLKYLNKFDTVFDPFSGYSGRLLGVCAANKKYIGQDINEITVKESNKLITDLNLNATISNKDSINDAGEYDCLFTCSPYSDKEIWNQKIEIKSCDEWVDLILNNYKCKEYLFVVDETDKYKDYIVEEIINTSHFGTNKEYIIHIK